MSTPAISFTLVGSGAVRVNPNRGGTCQLVRVGGENIVVDCGRAAVQNLEKFGCPPQDVGRVFISHHHFDHVCDLAHLLLLGWNNGRSHKLPVHGPPGIGDFLDQGLRRAYVQDIASRLSHGKDPAGLEWETVEINGDGEIHQGAGYTVAALASEHGRMPNYNFRFDAGGKRLVVTSDTEPSESLVPFCKGADLLVVECSGTREFLATVPWGRWHMCPETVSELATRADVKRVVLKHLVIENWVEDPDISDRMAASVINMTGIKAEAGFDGLVIEL